MTTSNNMKLNKIKPIFSNSKKQNDTAIEESFSDSSDNDFLQIVKKLYANQGISEFSDNEISKWLIASDLDVKKAIESINETLSWRKTIQIQSIIHHDYSDMSELGKIVLKGKSLDGSLLLWWIGNKNQWSNSKDREIKYFIHLIEKSRKEDSSLSKLTLVYDLNGTKSEKSDINLIFSLLEILGKHFPESLSRIFIFPKSSFTSMFMKMSPVNLKPEILSRITVSSGPETLFTCISTDNILTKYGGNLSLPALTETTPALPIKPIIEQIWVAPDDLL